MTITPASGSFQDCYFNLDGDSLAIGNQAIERRWRLVEGRLIGVSLLHKTTGRQWIPEAQSALPLTPPTAMTPRGDWEVDWQSGAESPVEAESLRLRLGHGGWERRLKIYPGLPAVTMRLCAVAAISTGGEPAASSDADPSGIEVAPSTAPSGPLPDVQDAIELDPLHLRVTEVRFVDQTDIHDNLVFQTRYLLHPAERQIALIGNLFFIEDPLTGHGIALLKHSPLPHARPVKTKTDLLVKGGTVALLGHGIGDAGGCGDEHSILLYEGFANGRTAVLHQLQQRIREYRAGRDGMFLSNTWGDRSKDGAINQTFMMKEIAAGARLGVDVIQIDDGWQRGRTANSVTAGGTWNGFWAADPNFWEHHPERFPQGLEPVIEAAKRQGMRFGLWYAPDSANDLVNWQRDAERIIRMHREWGVDFIKIDAVKMHSRAGQANNRAFYEMVLRETNGAVTFDTDVTAEIRPGYFGSMAVGPIFVENRYTDWHRYWPHRTLRNLWMLSHYIHPVRLRMEVLNPRRNTAFYEGDPLAPSRYSPACLFATVMFSSPLGWFETSNLADEDVAEIRELVKVWKAHRAAIHSSPILPIGEEPDGARWTGFAAMGGYLLAFRELSESESFEVPANLFGGGAVTVRKLAGQGDVELHEGRLRVRTDKLGFVFAQVEGSSQAKGDPSRPSMGTAGRVV